MSYGATAGLQEAVFQQLTNDAALSALVGGVYDALPSGTPPDLYISVGPETARDWSDNLSGGSEHDFTVSVISDQAGFLSAKQAAAAVSDALVDAKLTLSRGALVGLRFLKAVAVRDSSTDQRRIDMQFRARIEDS